MLPGSLEVAALFGTIRLAGVDGGSSFVVLAPSPLGQLRLFAGGNLAPVTLAMDDGDPSLLPGPLSAFLFTQGDLTGRTFGFPTILPNTTDAQRRALHNQRTTHAGDPEPVRIFADGAIDRLTLSVPKQARIGAGGDILDMVFIGQNIAANDITRITAGRDIVASSRVLSVQSAAGSANLPVLQGNVFTLGGPGALFVEAGRDLGPFLNSAVVGDGGGQNLTYGGGIITVGNDYNPWLAPVGAKIYAAFGVGKGADYGALLSTYVNPANTEALDGDLFVQSIDVNGNRAPDRSKPIYATALVGWLLENQPDAITRAFGAPIAITAADVLPLLAGLDAAVRTQFLVDLPYLPVGGAISSAAVAVDRSNASAPVLTTDAAAVAAAPSGQRSTISGSTLIGWLAQNAPAVLVAKYGVTTTAVGPAYAALTALPALVQRQFLVDRVYFNELAATSRPDGASFLQYLRGYRATELLFPAKSGYTDNLATYDLTATRPLKYLANVLTPTVALLGPDGERTTDPAVAAAIIDPVTGLPITFQGLRATEKLTGNLDLRLAALETQRGGDITILGPGGRVLGGSVVATRTQVTRRGQEVGTINLFTGQRRTNTIAPAARILSIPVGFEGVLTLRGGSVRSFTDGDFLLNQSRLFTLGGGDVTLWSSNSDLNAGQGSKTTASNPPVVVRFDPNGFGILDQAGSVSGAGIAALLPANGDRAPDVTLIAPVGTVDAGDAGVRASGNVFVAAAQVANADNFKVGGTTIGVTAASTVDNAAAANANAASGAAAQAAAAVNPSGNRSADDRSRISVEVLGFAGETKDDPCERPIDQRPANCPVARN